MDKNTEAAFDALNDLHTQLTEQGITNDQFLTALEMIRDLVDDDEDEDNEDI